jgi:hypothetical protein
MAKVIDLTQSDGDFVVLGRSIVLPNSTIDSLPTPLTGAIRFNPTIGKAQLYFDGTWNTIGDNSATIGSLTVSNDHTHEISHILGLQTALGNKAPLVHTHEISSIVGLAALLNDKAPLVHNHVISSITGLQAALDAKSNTGHTHTAQDNETISACLPGSPPSDFKLVWTATESITLPSGLQGSRVNVLANPSGNYTIQLFKNVTTNIGNIVITTVGDVIMTFTNTISFTNGDSLTFAFPTRDIAINTISISILANRSMTIS